MTYKSVIVTPYLPHGEGLKFAIENRGNTDIDLLQIEAWVPVELLATGWRSTQPYVQNILEFDTRSIDGKNYGYCLYTSSTTAQPTDSVPLIEARTYTKSFRPEC